MGSWSGGMWGEALQLGKQAAFKLRGAWGKGDLKSLFSRDLWFLKWGAAKVFKPTLKPRCLEIKPLTHSWRDSQQKSRSHFQTSFVVVSFSFWIMNEFEQGVSTNCFNFPQTPLRNMNKVLSISFVKYPIEILPFNQRHCAHIACKSYSVFLL